MVPPRPRRGTTGRVAGCGSEDSGKGGHSLANWNWKVVCQYISEHFGISLSRNSLNYLHRLGFAFKRPKKRLVRDAEKREAFVAEYAGPGQWRLERRYSSDEAHFRARRVAGQVGAERRASLGGLDQPALWREGQLLLGGVSGDRLGIWRGTATEFLAQLRLNVIWDNAPAHRGEAVREYLRTPGW